MQSVFIETILTKIDIEDVALTAVRLIGKQVNDNHFYNKISSNYASGSQRVWILKGLIWLSERYMLVSMILR